MPEPVTTIPPAWRRPQWEPGGGDASVRFEVWAPAFAPLTLSPERHRVAALPEGLETRLWTRAAEAAELEALLGPPLGDLVRVDGVPLATALDGAGACLLVVGTVRDPSDLGYLRGAVGVVTAALDAGGSVVVEPQALLARSAGAWRADVFAPDAHRGAHHVSLARAPEAAAPADPPAFWVHTRGMRLYGRPDLSLHRVPVAGLQAAADLMVLLCELQIRGGVLRDGQPITLEGPFAGWVCRPGGDLDDPILGNRRITVEPG